jgi:hypothetical protein
MEYINNMGDVIWMPTAKSPDHRARRVDFHDVFEYSSFLAAERTALSYAVDETARPGKIVCL